MPEWLTTILVVIIGPGGILTAWLLYRREDKKAPIERIDAQVAQAIAMSTTANAMYQTVTAHSATQDKKIETQDGKIQTLEEKADFQELRINKWVNWYHYDIVTGWPIHRLKETAPLPPE